MANEENWSTAEWARAGDIVAEGLDEALGDVIHKGLVARIAPNQLYLAVLYRIHEVFVDEHAVPITNGAVLMGEVAVQLGAEKTGRTAESIRAQLVAALSQGN
jgi:hypothetical protein